MLSLIAYEEAYASEKKVSNFIYIEIVEKSDDTSIADSLLKCFIRNSSKNALCLVKLEVISTNITFGDESSDY